MAKTIKKIEQTINEPTLQTPKLANFRNFKVENM
jgi:hypothetical protein